MNKTVTSIIAALVVIGIIGTIVIMNNSGDKPAENSSETSRDNTSGDDAEAPATSTQETNAVTYKDFAVVQKTIKVKKGTTVTWTNQDDANHDVTPDTETADFKATELFGKGESKKITFNTVGTYPYHCSPHPYMKGVVEVVE